MELRYELSNLIMNSEIDINIIKEINCESTMELAEKIKNKNYYADHLEIYFLSKLLNIFIAIFNYNRNKWNIVNHVDIKNPTNIAFVIFKESTHELGNHYNIFRIEKSKKEGKIQSHPNENENITIDSKLK